MVDSGIAAGLAQAPSVEQGDMGLSPHLLPHEIRDKWLAVSNKQSMSNDPAHADAGATQLWGQWLLLANKQVLVG